MGNWLSYKADRDPWGKALLAAGVKPKTIKDWSLDPQVTYGSKLAPTTKSIWDTLEDMDAQPCINTCKEIAAWRPLKKPKFMKVKQINPDSKGLNLYLKCVSAPTPVEGVPDIKEVVLGDDTGCFILSTKYEAFGRVQRRRTAPHAERSRQHASEKRLHSCCVGPVGSA